jgi:hypothetical protein
MKEVSLLYCLPDNPFFLNTPGGHAVQEATYSCGFPSSSPSSRLKRLSCPTVAINVINFNFLNTDCGWIFAQHFCNRLGPAYLQLKNILDENDPAHAEVLNDIKRRFREETFTRESIANVIHAHPELVHSFALFYD